MTIQTIPVWSTATGKRHVLTINQPYRRYPTLSGGNDPVPMLATLRLEDGRPLSTVSIGTYQDQWSDEQFSTSRPVGAAA